MRMVLKLSLAALSAATLLESPRASAEWYCQVVDGPNAPTGSNANAGSTTDHCSGASAVATYSGLAYPMYTCNNASLGYQYSRYGADWNFGVACPSYPSGCGNGYNDPPAWYLAGIDGSTSYSVNPPGAMNSDSSTIWIAYTDSCGAVYASTHASPGPGQGAIAYPQHCGVPIYQATGTPSVVDFLGTPTIVWAQNHEAIFAQEYNPITDGWSAPPTVVDGLNNPHDNDGMDQPATAVFTPYGGSSTLYVFMWDQAAGTLMMNTNTGSGWGQMAHSLDGDGQGSFDFVGEFPSAFVDTTGASPVLRVFYSDYGSWNGKTGLWVASLAATSGATWTYQALDTGITMGSPAAAVNHGGDFQVYYIDTTTQALKVVTAYEDGSWTSPVVVDGPAPSGTQNLCNSQGGGGTTGGVSGPVAVIERAPPWERNGSQWVHFGQTGPHVFYSDASHNLRQAYWY